MGTTQAKPARSASNAVGATSSSSGAAAKSAALPRRPDKNLKIVFTGAGGSGKTSLLYALKFGEEMGTVIPTVGFNVEDVALGKSTTLTIWDVGGGDKISPLLYHYTTESHGLVFFIPSFWQRNDWGTKWLQTFDPSRIETASHYDPEWVHQLRRHASTRGMPLMIVVNEPKDRSQIRITQDDILKTFRLRNVHERPTKVVTLTHGPSPDNGMPGQMYAELAWFHDIECRYAAGDVWVSLPLSLFLPPVVRRTANVLKHVEAYLGGNKVFGFVSAASLRRRSADAEWIVRQARDNNHHVVGRGSGGSTRSAMPPISAVMMLFSRADLGHTPNTSPWDLERAAAATQASYNRHGLSLEFQERLMSSDCRSGAGVSDMLGSGTHYDLLRMLYESIHRNGRKNALKVLFRDLESPTEAGGAGGTGEATTAAAAAAAAAASASVSTPATTPTAWLPVTSTYFWLHMIDYYRQVVARRLGEHQLTFRTLCEECPFLSHPVLIYDYYTRERVKNGAKEMVLPDLKPLPSVLPKANTFQHGEF
jgi:hypothetical protein